MSRGGEAAVEDGSCGKLFASKYTNMKLFQKFNWKSENNIELYNYDKCVEPLVLKLAGR